MARFPLALAGAITTSILLVMPTVAGASTTPATGGHKGLCTAHSTSQARHATRSFHQAHCVKGRHVKIRAHKSHQLFFTAKNGVCPYARLSPTVRNIRLVRAATLCLVNRERARHGEPALRWNERLVRAAQGHTESMAFGNYFEHVGPRGQTPLMRMRETGYISSRMAFEVGENIAWGSLWLGTPRAIVASWMASAGHRANILDARYRETGIGVSPHTAALAHGQSGGIYTQDFGVRIG
jgi:uncharacterized protein YkwD